MKIIYPPRPKSKIHPNDLPYYESTDNWCVQRKFNGFRNLIHISPEKVVTFASRHGQEHKKFILNKSQREELLSVLNLQKGLEYWIDSELMAKEANAVNEIILFDILQVGRYFFGFPNQMGRLELLKEICGNPQVLEPGKIALQMSPRVWMAETWTSNFVDRFKESLPNPRLEGLVLRKKNSALDNFGQKEYETGNIIRCRKAFQADKGAEASPRAYNF